MYMCLLDMLFLENNIYKRFYCQRVWTPKMKDHWNFPKKYEYQSWALGNNNNDKMIPYLLYLHKHSLVQNTDPQHISRLKYISMTTFFLGPLLLHDCLVFSFFLLVVVPENCNHIILFWRMWTCFQFHGILGTFHNVAMFLPHTVHKLYYTI